MCGNICVKADNLFLSYSLHFLYAYGNCTINRQESTRGVLSIIITLHLENQRRAPLPHDVALLGQATYPIFQVRVYETNLHLENQRRAPLPQDVALLALTRTYGIKGIGAEAPEFEEYEITEADAAERAVIAGTAVAERTNVQGKSNWCSLNNL